MEMMLASSYISGFNQEGICLLDGGYGTGGDNQSSTAHRYKCPFMKWQSCIKKGNVLFMKW